MPIVRGCELKDDLLYDVANNIWYNDNGDGTVTIGMTAVAAAMAGEVVAFTPKKVGRKVAEGKSCATIESGKWVGPARLSVPGEVSEVNEALSATPSLANGDPYGEGWMIRLKPDDWEAGKAGLILGTDVGPAYEKKMAQDEFPGCAEAA